MVKRALITGAGGFIGFHVVSHLLIHTDWEIVVTDSFRHYGKTDRIVLALRSYSEQAHRVTVVTHDLTVPWSAQGIDQLGRIDHVINLASLSHVDDSIITPVPFIRNNVDIALNMLELARVLKPATFIQFSTDEVYGPAEIGTAHAEWSAILPSNPYASSKAAQEAIAISYWRTYDVPVIVTNGMNLIGQTQDPIKYLPMLISRISRGETVTVHGRPGYIGSRYYLHARNVADALLHILTYLAPRSYVNGAVDRPDRYNIVGEREIDNLELAQLVADHLGQPLHYELQDFHLTRPGHDRRYALDGLLLAATGWTPPVPLAESIEQIVDWTIKHPEWLLP